MKRSEQESQQADFEIGRQISMLYRTSQSFYSGKTNNLDIGAGHMSIIFYLFHHVSASQDELTKFLEVDKATIARSVKKLEQSGLIMRTKDEKDSRVNRITLTEAGYLAQVDLKKLTKQWQSILLNNFTDEEIHMLQPLMDKLMENARTFRHSNCNLKGHSHDK